MNVRTKIEVRSLPVPEIIAIAVFGRCGLGVLGVPQSWGRECVGGRIPFERALVSSYRLSILTVPPSLRVSEILSLLCSSTPLFTHPTSRLPKIFPCSPGSSGWPLGYEERMCCANCPWNYFPRFPTYVIWSTNVTDRQTDDMQSEYRALHYSASRGKNSYQLDVEKWSPKSVGRCSICSVVSKWQR